jgi:hypothetical protein
MTKAVNSTESAQSTVQWPFKLESIAKAAAPGGAEGMWHRYVISQGKNTIEGVRAGTDAEVTTLVHDMIERLNEQGWSPRRTSRSKLAGISTAN